jgi:hypothetical protein
VLNNVSLVSPQATARKNVKTKNRLMWPKIDCCQQLSIPIAYILLGAINIAVIAWLQGVLDRPS